MQKTFVIFMMFVVILIITGHMYLKYNAREKNVPNSKPHSVISLTSSSSLMATQSEWSEDTKQPGLNEGKKQDRTKKRTLKSTMTTLFWVGEPAGADNAFITNTESYWDEKWQEHYGGVDDPECRKGNVPCNFKPKENPFYFALPYAEYNPAGILKNSASRIPWAIGSKVPHALGNDHLPLLKNRWIAVTHYGTTCYGQWEDVGPNNEDDYAYVFGSAVSPSNTFGERAGLDVSPALWRCLGLADNSITSWEFIDVASVPRGPWTDIVTVSGTSWTN